MDENNKVDNDSSTTDWRNHVLFAPLEILVPGSKPITIAPCENDCQTPSHNAVASIPLLFTDTPISFWGGIDTETSRIIDTTHPLFSRTIRRNNTAQCNSTTPNIIPDTDLFTKVNNTILCLPSGRGSCTASQALLELILNDVAPTAIILKEVDSILCVGAIVAREVFRQEVLGSCLLGEDGTLGSVDNVNANIRGKVPLIAKVLDRDWRDWVWMPPSLQQHSDDLSLMELSSSDSSTSLFSAIGSTGFSHASILIPPERAENHSSHEMDPNQSWIESITRRNAILVAASNPYYLQCGIKKVHSSNFQSFSDSDNTSSNDSPTSIYFPPLTSKNTLQLTPEESSILNGSHSTLPTTESRNSTTPAHTLAMKVICQVAHIQNATRLQKVTRVC